MGVDPEFERKASANGRLEGDLSCRTPIDEHTVVGVDQDRRFQTRHHREDVHAVPTTCF